MVLYGCWDNVVKGEKRMFLFLFFKNIVRIGVYENLYFMRCIRKKRYES